MSTYYGVNATLLYTGGLASKLGQGLFDARVKVIRDYYTIGGSSETTGTVLQFAGYGTEGQIPVGAKIIAIGLGVTAAQSSLTFSLGNTASATAYLAAGATSLQAIGYYLFPGKQTTVGTTAGDDDVLLTTSAATMTAGILYVDIFYSID